MDSIIDNPTTECKDLSERKLKRAQDQVRILESMIEDKTREVYLSNQQLNGAVDRLTRLYQVLPEALLVSGPNGTIRQVNPATLALLDFEEADLIGKKVNAVFPDYDLGAKLTTSHMQEHVWINSDGEHIPVAVSTAQLERSDDSGIDYVCVGIDLRERKRLELELRHAQKLESIGQLAAGIAHEINTPMQFIGDNVHFLEEVFTDLLNLHDTYARLKPLLEKSNHPYLEKLIDAEDDADIDYIRERVPQAIERTIDGIQRVSRIVSAMKDFSHPTNDFAPVDINRSIGTALTVAVNEYKYVADVETAFGELPMVVCQGGDINQVILNLVINAAHAIGDAQTDGEPRGLIRVSTSLEGDSVLISVADNGTGIPEEIQHRIYDPFFTTKTVGEGTGQGLSMVHSIIVERHSGSLTYETEKGVGTTFHIRLPVNGGKA